MEELAAILDLSSATGSHHLRRLVEADLVQATAQQHYHIYSLKLQSLRERAQELLAEETWQVPTEELDLDAYDRKVLRDYMDAGSGRLKQIPRQLKKREVILRYLLEQFEPDRDYTEAKVNEIIAQFHEDYATLRRELVDSQRLARDHEIYWRVS